MDLRDVFKRLEEIKKSGSLDEQYLAEFVHNDVAKEALALMRVQYPGFDYKMVTERKMTVFYVTRTVSAFLRGI